MIQSIKTLKFLEVKNKDYVDMFMYYVKQFGTKIITIKGVGHITVDIILGEIGDITRFKNAEHLISYAELDIEVYEFGNFKTTNHMISKKGSKYLRYGLWQKAKLWWQIYNLQPILS